MRAFESKRSDLLDLLARGWRGYVLVACLAAFCALPGLVRVGPLDRDESRYAQATVQMLETGDFVRLFVQEDPRHKKPAGLHWLQAASVAAFSSPSAREISAYRLPSLLGAVLAAVAAFWGGTALVGRRAAFIGAAGLACSVLLSTEGMIAKTDAALCGLLTLALAAIAHLRVRPQGRSGRGLAILIWALVGFGILIKGPIAPMVAGLTLAALAGWERRIGWAAPLAWWPGPALAAAIVLPWFVAIGILTNGEYFLEAIGHDLGAKVTASAEHPAVPPGLHTLLIPLLLFPMTLGLPGGVRLAWQAARGPRLAPEHAGIRFLLAWALPSLLVFEAAPVKLAHYTLPIYPALALLAGAGLVAAFERDWSGEKRLGLSLYVGFGAVLTLLAGAVATFVPPLGEGFQPGWSGALLSAANPAVAAEDLRRAIQVWILGGAGLAACALILALAGRRLTLWVALIILTGAVAMWGVRARILPEARELALSVEASSALDRADLHPRLDKAGRLLMIGYSEPSLVFLTRTDVQLATGEEAGALAQEGRAILVEGAAKAAFEAGLAGRGLAFQPIGPAVRGLNYTRGDPQSLQPGRVIAAAAQPMER